MVFNLQNGHEYVVEMAIFNICYSQRTATPKVCQQEIRFLCSARCLIVFYIYKKIHNNISNGFQLTERTRVHGKNGYV